MGAAWRRVIQGLEVADAWNAEYLEGLGGIRAGKQDAGVRRATSREAGVPWRQAEPRAGTARAR